MQQAWLHTPLAKMPGKPTRADKLREEGKPLPLPKNPAPELVEIFHKIGPGMDINGMGWAPLTAQELAAWDRGSRLFLGPWEFDTLLVMSQAYVNQNRISGNIDAPPPWSAAPDPEKRVSIAKSVRSFLRD